MPARVSVTTYFISFVFVGDVGFQVERLPIVSTLWRITCFICNRYATAMIQVGAPFRVKSCLRFRIEALSENQENATVEQVSWSGSRGSYVNRVTVHHYRRHQSSISLDHNRVCFHIFPFSISLGMALFATEIVSVCTVDIFTRCHCHLENWLLRFLSDLFPPISTAPPGSMLTKQYPQYFSLTVESNGKIGGFILLNLRKPMGSSQHGHTEAYRSNLQKKFSRSVWQVERRARYKL